MRWQSFLFVPLLLCVFPLGAQDNKGNKVSDDDLDENPWQCPHAPVLPNAPSEKHWLIGRIGPHPVRMYLEHGGDVVIGDFYFIDAHWTPVVLGGSWKGSNLNAKEVPDDTQADQHKALGNLSGTFSATGFEGIWTAAGVSSSLSASLHFEPKVDCDHATTWKKFADPRWPITFSYPASWQLVKNPPQLGDHGPSLTITCPDPSAMLDSDGEFVRSGPTLGPSNSTLAGDDFERIKGRWMFAHGDCSGDDASPCTPADATKRGPLTILDGSDHEWRAYCAVGGYLGQTEGEDLTVVVGKRWAEFSGIPDITGRIVDTVRARSHAPQ
jgi:hypothetical protein